MVKPKLVVPCTCNFCCAGWVTTRYQNTADSVADAKMGCDTKSMGPYLQKGTLIRFFTLNSLCIETFRSRMNEVLANGPVNGGPLTSDCRVRRRQALILDHHSASYCSSQHPAVMRGPTFFALGSD